MQISRILPHTVKKYWLANIWDRFTEEQRYSDSINSELSRQRMKTLEFVRSSAQGLTVMDACCGTGKVAIELSNLENVKSVVAFDINEKAIAKAKKYCESSCSNTQKISFLVADADDLDNIFAHTKFDLVICIDALHHLADPRSTLQSLVRRTRPGGKVAGNVLASERFREWQIEKHGTMNFSIQHLVYRSAQVMTEVSRGDSLAESFGENGIIRIRPFSREELVSILPSLLQTEIESDFYHWFTGGCKK